MDALRRMGNPNTNDREHFRLAVRDHLSQEVMFMVRLKRAEGRAFQGEKRANVKTPRWCVSYLLPCNKAWHL